MAKRFNRLLMLIATCGFIGYLPGAPGTYASIFGCLILYLLPFTSPAWNIITACVVAAGSVICINNLVYAGEDPSYIVIDEVAGIFVAMAGHEINGLNLLIGFISFRVFDIIKPYPIRKVESLKGGYGIVADDVLAGIFANLVLYLFLFVYGEL